MSDLLHCFSLSPLQVESDSIICGQHQHGPLGDVGVRDAGSSLVADGRVFLLDLLVRRKRFHAGNGWVAGGCWDYHS